MKLYIYEHCPFCVRARMIFGLKVIPAELTVIMEGDSATPISMVGRKVVPILEKEDGTFMAESMDIVRYIDGSEGPAVLKHPVSAEIECWARETSPAIYKLVVPRFTRSDFAELATEEARAAYLHREEKAFGSMDALIQLTPTLLREVEQQLAVLKPNLCQSEKPDANDFIIFPLLRSLTIVQGITFSDTIINYLERMSLHTGVDLLFNKAI